MKRILKYALIALVVGVTLVTYINKQNIESFDISPYQEFSDTLSSIREKREQQKRIDRRNELKQSIINAHPDLIEDGFEFTSLFVGDELLDENIDVYVHFTKKRSTNRKLRLGNGLYVEDLEYQRVILKGFEKKYMLESYVPELNNRPLIYFYETDTKIFLRDLQPFPLVNQFDPIINIEDNPELQKYFLYDLSISGRMVATKIKNRFSDNIFNIDYYLYAEDELSHLRCEECLGSEVYRVNITLDENGGFLDKHIYKSFFDVNTLLNSLPLFDRRITEQAYRGRVGDIYRHINNHSQNIDRFKLSDYLTKEKDNRDNNLYDISAFINDYIESMEAQGYTQKF